MRRALIFIVAIQILFSAGCAARVVAPLPPGPFLLIQEALPDTYRLCVLLKPLRSPAQSIGCVTVGELRASVRGRRTIALEAGS